MTTRRTLLLAVAYVLLLAVVAFGVPLAISLRDRVDAEVRGQARSQADLLAASAPELLGAANRRTLDRLVATSAGSVRGRVVVTDRSGKLIADSAGDGELGADFAGRPEITSAPCAASSATIRPRRATSRPFAVSASASRRAER